MPEIGVYEAKTHLARLLERVRKGEKFVITRHGRPIALLTPVAEHNAEAVRDALARVRAGREALARKSLRLKDLLEKGERLRDFMHRGHRY
jgi:prevent-host-death family protein